LQNKVEEVVQEALKDWLSTGQLVERSNKKKREAGRGDGKRGR
jgi:hypothetical protein